MKPTMILFCSFVLLFWNSAADAQQWQSFTAENSALPANSVNAVDLDEFGTLWFGTDSGLAAFNGAAWHTYTEQDRLANNQVNDFSIVPGPEMWVATQNGISDIHIYTFDAITMATPLRTDNTGLLSNVINRIVTAGNNHWFGTDSGVTVFTGFEWITSKIQQAVLKFDVRALAVSPDTLVYCGTEGAGVARLKLSGQDIVTGASTIERPWASVPIDSVFAIHIGADGYQWFGTRHGLFRHQGINSKQNWHSFTVANGLPHRQVQAITEDAAGKIWVGTQAGVTCLSKDFSDFVNYSVTDGLVHPDVRDIAIAAEGEIWFATAGGVSRFSPKANSVSFAPTNALPDAEKISVYPNPFNSSTVIEYYVSQPGKVELAIYNILGQPVCELYHGPAEPGTHSIRWNGEDANGLSVPSGLYLARLFSNATVDLQKMLVVK